MNAGCFILCHSYIRKPNGVALFYDYCFIHNGKKVPLHESQLLQLHCKIANYLNLWIHIYCCIKKEIVKIPLTETQIKTTMAEQLLATKRKF